MQQAEVFALAGGVPLEVGVDRLADASLVGAGRALRHHSPHEPIVSTVPQRQHQSCPRRQFAHVPQHSAAGEGSGRR